MKDSPFVYIDHVIYGPTPEESRVVLSNGQWLAGIEFCAPHEISNDRECRLSLIVRFQQSPTQKRPN